MNSPSYPRHDSDEYESMHGKARRTDPSTSHVAAARVDAKGQRERIMRVLRDVPPSVHESLCGLTADELDLWLGWRVTTAGRRLSELRRAGRVEKCGQRYTRSGRPAAVYRVVS